MVTANDTQATEAFVGRLFEATLGTADILSIYVGDKLGFYHSLAQKGPATTTELAKRTKTYERYVREWLEQQAVTGILTVDDPKLPESQRRYTLPTAHAAALIEPDNPFSFGPVGKFVVAAATMLPDILNAFRNGGGVPWSAYGRDVVEAQGDFNRPWLIHQLGNE